MTTILPLPKIEISDLSSVEEDRPVALLTGERSWAAVSPLLALPLVVQAEPYRVEVDYLDSLANDLPPEGDAAFWVRALVGQVRGLREELDVVCPWLPELRAFLSEPERERGTDFGPSLPLGLGQELNTPAGVRHWAQRLPALRAELARTPGLVAHVTEEKTRQPPMRRIDPVAHTYDGPPARPV